jgi:hypothetical protein
MNVARRQGGKIIVKMEGEKPGNLARNEDEKGRQGDFGMVIRVLPPSSSAVWLKLISLVTSEVSADVSVLHPRNSQVRNFGDFLKSKLTSNTSHSMGQSSIVTGEPLMSAIQL